MGDQVIKKREHPMNSRVGRLECSLKWFYAAQRSKIHQKGGVNGRFLMLWGERRVIWSLLGGFPQMEERQKGLG